MDSLQNPFGELIKTHLTSTYGKRFQVFNLFFPGKLKESDLNTVTHYDMAPWFKRIHVQVDDRNPLVVTFASLQLRNPLVVT